MACIITIACWIVMVIAGVTCLVEISDKESLDWLTRLVLHTSKDTNTTEKFTIKEFKLAPNSLHVLSKIRKSKRKGTTDHQGVAIGELTNTTDESINDDCVDPVNGLQNTHECSAPSAVTHQPSRPPEVNGELCTNSGIGTGEFDCSELLPSIRNIFFLETSCAANQSSAIPRETGPPLSEKQSCAIYSAAYYNPSRNVTLLFTCAVPLGHSWSKEWNALFDLENFYFGWVDLAKLYANSSVEQLYHGPLAQSKFHVSHQSDLFRQFVLYVYGGTYMDLDVISFKSLDPLGTNYLIHQGDDQITAGVWNLQPRHVFLRNCLLSAITRYKPNDWPTIGPALYTEVFRELCNVTTELIPTKAMNLSSCGLRVLPLTTFFSVNYLKWEQFYRCDLWPMVEKMTKNSYGVHYWNHKGNQVLYVGSRQPLVRFAQKHCPRVYREAGPTLT